jgi:hypothetical protein
MTDKTFAVQSDQSKGRNTMSINRASRRLLIGAALLVGTLAGGSLSAEHASAQFAVCYGDPIVFLSNGSMLKLSFSAQTGAANVQAAQYTLHLPAGVSITKINTSGNNIGDMETVVPVNDNPAGLYSSDTLVTASVSVPLTASESLQGSGWTSVSTNGMTNSDAWTSIQS